MAQGSRAPSSLHRTSPVIRSVKNIPLAGRRVFIRADFDLPLGKKSGVPQRRIADSLPTIRLALEQKARVVVLTHQGSLKAAWHPERTLEPSVQYAVAQLDTEAILADDCAGDAVRKLLGDLGEGQLLFLENLACRSWEIDCRQEYAAFLAKYCDVYVNEAFAQANRRLTSTVLLPALVEDKCAGLRFIEEAARLDAVRFKHLPACEALNEA